MKKFALIIFLLISLFYGCNDNIVDSNNNNVEPQALTKAPPSSGLLNGGLFNNRNKGNSITDGDGFAAQIIDGSKGGTIILYDLEFNLTGLVVTNAILKFPAGAFEGTEKITMITNSDNGTIDLFPSMKFNKEVLLNASFTGIKLDKLYGLLNLNKLKFYHVKENGELEDVSNDEVYIGLLSGLIGVKNARLNHFSRYAWSK